MGWHRPPMPITVERVPRWFIDRYRNIREPREQLDRPRLGERQERRAATKLRPHSEQLGEVSIRSNFGRKLKVNRAGAAMNGPAHDPPEVTR